MLIDDILPDYDITEIHRIDIRAGPERVFDAINAVTTADLPLFRLLYGIRMLPARLSGRGGNFAPGRLVDWAEEVGLLIGQRPGEELVFGVIGQFWRPLGGTFPKFAGAAAFRAFERPGYVRVATNFQVSAGPGGSTRLITETRIQALDAASRRKFRAYWFVIYPGSSLIRREWLRIIRRRAEAARQPAGEGSGAGRAPGSSI